MIIGLAGASAIGKTFFVNHWLDRVKNSPYSHGRLIVINADAPHKCVVDKAGNLLYPHVKGVVWKPYKETTHLKFAEIDCMMADDKHMYVVESSKYFSGPQKYLGDGLRTYGGGVHLILLICEVEFLRSVLTTRCESTGRQMRWNEHTLQYEAQDRLINLSRKHLDPLGIPHTLVSMESRKQFSKVGQLLDTYLRNPGLWYGSVP